MKLDGRQRSRIVGKLIEASIKNDEDSLKRIFTYDYHHLMSEYLMRRHDDK